MSVHRRFADSGPSPMPKSASLSGNAVQLRIFFQVFDGIAFRQGFNDTGALTPPSFFHDGELKLDAQAQQVGGKFSWCHPGRPDHFILQDVQGAQKTEARWFNLGLNGRLGHFQTDEIVSNQGAPDFLFDPLGLLATQGQPDFDALMARIHHYINAM